MSFRHLIFDVPLAGPGPETWKYEALGNALTRGYFSVQNQVLFEQFWMELITAQDALLALGANYFDPQAVRASIFQNQQVAVFLNLGASRTGHVAPAGIGFINIELANMHDQVPRLLNQLKAEYGFRQFDDLPFHSSIKLFASFVARARRHQLSGRAEEALLHFIIALELMFGVRETIQKKRSGCRRSPIFTSRPIPSTSTFLAPCSADLAKIAPAICVDTDGFDRAAFHKEFDADVVAFFLKHLGEALQQ